MQEEQTVSFEAVGFEVHVPWFVNLFLLYLLYVLLRTIAQAVWLVWDLRKTARAQKREAFIESDAETLWETCRARIRSIRNFSHLTFLLALLVLSWNATDVLAGISTAKAASLPSMAERLAQALVPFTMGIVFSSGQFCCAMLLESFVRRRKQLLARKSGQTITVDPKAKSFWG
ncbi:hypothetical protein [Occallatibacter savannae]|uniref:hypothetical protein n=1 Tax=Occallatibacter savannae TaxID=1002691 RepID=UPI000D693C06|nr:hypothetical protein [Occallatibacter savannae]